MRLCLFARVNLSCLNLLEDPTPSLTSSWPLRLTLPTTTRWTSEEEIEIATEIETGTATATETEIVEETVIETIVIVGETVIMVETGVIETVGVIEERGGEIGGEEMIGIMIEEDVGLEVRLFDFYLHSHLFSFVSSSLYLPFFFTKKQ